MNKGLFSGAKPNSDNAKDSVTTPIIKPLVDASPSLLITKADGTTPILSIDSTNNRVGIGTATPGLTTGSSSTILDIEGPTNPIIALKNTTAAQQWAYYVANDGQFHLFDATNTINAFNLTPGSSGTLTTIGGIITPTSISTPVLKPPSDSTTALKVTKADGTTSIVNVDTTNSRVGIGTTGPTEQLHLYAATPSLQFDTSGLAGGVLTIYNNSTSGPTITYLTDSSNNSTFNINAARWAINSYGHALDTSPATAVSGARTWTTALWINTGRNGTQGNVGIGTFSAATAPTAQLHTTGTVRMANFGAGVATFDASGNISSQAWTSYTPTVTAGTGTFTTTSSTGRYMNINKLIVFELSVTITTVGTGGSSVNATLPATPNGIYTFTGRENAVTGSPLFAVAFGTTTCFIVNFANGFVGGNGYVLTINGTYEST